MVKPPHSFFIPPSLVVDFHLEDQIHQLVPVSKVALIVDQVTYQSRLITAGHELVECLMHAVGRVLQQFRVVLRAWSVGRRAGGGLVRTSLQFPPLVSSQPVQLSPPSAVVHVSSETFEQVDNVLGRQFLLKFTMLIPWPDISSEHCVQ